MSQTMNITIQKWTPLPHGRIKIKIAEAHFNPDTINHEGKVYDVVNRYGRGRMIVKEGKVKE